VPLEVFLALESGRSGVAISLSLVLLVVCLAVLVGLRERWLGPSARAEPKRRWLGPLERHP